jgi:Casein kinase II regulatory subunit
VLNHSSWISWFLSSKGNEYFCEVEEDYILDRFNLTGLNTEVQNYTQALDLITDNLGARLTDLPVVYCIWLELDPDDDFQEELRGTLDIQARLLYGLIHARWIVTARGLAKMVRPTLISRSAVESSYTQELKSTTPNLFCCSLFPLFPVKKNTAGQIQKGRFRSMPARALSRPTASPSRPDRRAVRKVCQALLRPL